jgi:hypothetical protein
MMVKHTCEQCGRPLLKLLNFNILGPLGDGGNFGTSDAEGRHLILNKFNICEEIQNAKSTLL